MSELCEFTGVRWTGVDTSQLILFVQSPSSSMCESEEIDGQLWLNEARHR